MAVSTLTAISSGISTISNVLLVSPQKTVGYQPTPINTANGSPLPLPPSILFHYEGENTGTIESDITDHFVENNTAIQNQIALRPVIITTQGFIGELNNVPPNIAFQIAQQVAQKLVALGGYAPSLSSTALIAYNEALFAYQTAASLVNSAVSAFASITGQGGETVIDGLTVSTQPNQTKQQQYFQQFYGYWATRTLFTVQTPWAIFQNMAIKSLRAIQSAETNTITDFEVQFKQIRFATTSFSTTTLYSNVAGNSQGRLQNQAATLTPLGTSALTPSTTAFNPGAVA